MNMSSNVENSVVDKNDSVILIDGTGDEESICDEEDVQIIVVENEKLPGCGSIAKIFRDSFSAYRNQLAVQLFNLYNENVFSNVIHSDTSIEWSDMTETAGFCYFIRINRLDDSTERRIKIVLSTKLMDSVDYLRDTLIHEMCHGAVWIVDKLRGGHDSCFEAWVERAITTFPELPSQIKSSYRCVKSNNRYFCNWIDIEQK